MQRLLTALVLIPIVLLAVFKAPLWLFAAGVAVVMLQALLEYLNLVEAYGAPALRQEALFLSILVVLGTWCVSDQRLWSRYFFVQPLWLFGHWQILLILPLFVGIPLVFRKDLQGALPAAAGSALGVLYVAAPLALLIALRADAVLCVLVIFILFSVWSGDIAAYYVGKTMGRHLLAPVVSPKKTWEGAIASVAASILMAWIVFHFQVRIQSLFSPLWPASAAPLPDAQRPVALAHVFILGILTNIAAQLGDLFESAIKRGAQVKDSGSLLPGHGGMLDRIDALLFAIPAVWYYAMLTRFLQPGTL